MTKRSLTSIYARIPLNAIFSILFWAIEVKSQQRDLKPED